jgi:CubicO group peptidase (beta-lactamase class C family)
VTQASRRIAAGWGGAAVSRPERHAAAEDTLWDVASLTKPLATALIALRSAQAGRLDLLEPLPETDPPCTPLGLLRHEAGFPPWLPVYGFARDRAEARRWLASGCPRRPGPGVPKYSCLGYLLLGLHLEETLGAPLASLFQECVAAPLGLTGGTATFRPPDAVRTAATELDGAHETSLAASHGAQPPPFAGGQAWGEVHDGNARFLGAGAGNAGLFASLEAVERLCEAFRPAAGFLDGRSLVLAWDSPHGKGQRRTAGWKASDSEGWPVAPLLRAGSLGHEGFTGTAAYLEPGEGRTFILLTNRIHPVHPRTDFAPVRAAFLRSAGDLP